MVLRMQEHDLLILGAGWTSTFLIPLLRQRKSSFSATTTDGRDVAGAKTIKWKFDTKSDDAEKEVAALPLAKCVLITFPLKTTDETKFLVEQYTSTHKRSSGDVHFIQLGSTGIWQIPQKTIWVSRRSPYDTSSPRAIAEDELLKLGGCVLNLAGLWGGERDPSKWVDRVATTKESVKSKKSLHMVHGLDVSRAVLAVMDSWQHGEGQRWMLTDGFVYDWYSLFAGWADPKNDGKTVDETESQSQDKAEAVPSKQAQWVFELMQEEQIWALPRSMESLGRCYFGREFWDTFKLTPVRSRV